MADSPDVFICYRHGDARDIVDRMYDYLRKELGENRVFRDVEGIGHGAIIRERVDTALKGCKILLVVVGNTWAEHAEGEQLNRLFDPEDYVRHEISAALAAGSQIIPVTVHGARLPDRTHIPAELGKALDRLATPVRGNPDFGNDMKGLAHRVKEALLDHAEKRPAGATPAPTSVRIFGRSTLFYWWPVWFVGFIFAIATYWEDSRMAVVPLKLSKGRDLQEWSALPNRISDQGWYGYAFAVILLAVIVFTTIRLQGLWSVIAINGIILVLILLSLMGDYFESMRIHLTFGGYLFLATFLFLLWILVVFGFDRQIYVTFTLREILVCSDLITPELKLSVFNMTVKKRTDGEFRHWLLGSGDLVIQTAGVDGREFIFFNVLLINQKLRMLKWMYKDSPVDIML